MLDALTGSRLLREIPLVADWTLRDMWTAMGWPARVVVIIWAFSLGAMLSGRVRFTVDQLLSKHRRVAFIVVLAFALLFLFLMLRNSAPPPVSNSAPAPVKEELDKHSKEFARDYLTPPDSFFS